MSDPKRELVRSWLAKAQRDLASARALAAADPPLLDTAVYHCQQAAEKAIKAFLVFCDCEFGRVHDLEALVIAAAPFAAAFWDWADAARRLTPYVRIYRYPGYADEPTPPEFGEALEDAEGIFAFVLSLLPEDMHP